MMSSRISAVAMMLSLVGGVGAAEIFPKDGAATIPADTQLKVVFSSPPALSHHGTIQILDASTHSVVEIVDTANATETEAIGGVPDFNYYPVTIDGNVATIHPRNGVLGYGKTYRVVIDPGVFGTDPAIGRWQFSTRPAAPVPTNGTITIAADDSADFATVQGAVDSLPANNTAPTTLFIKKGVYTEMVCILNKHHLTFKGEDRKETIIAYADNDRFNNNSANHTYHRGMFLAHHCDELTLSTLTLHNTTPQGGSQAEAIILNGSPTARAVLDGVDLYSYQDTLQINGQAYIVNSCIEGDVDFMWGTGPCFFENCECKGLRSKAYYTQIRNTQSNHGYVYYHCRFDAAAGVKDIFLSRIEPGRFPYSEVALMDCVIADGAVSGVAWKLDAAKGAKPTATQQAAAQVHFWEFHSHTPDGKPVDTSERLSMSRQLHEPEDANLISLYSDPAFILGDNWNPRSAAPVVEGGK